jgi:hypothetical protein
MWYDRLDYIAGFAYFAVNSTDFNFTHFADFADFANFADFVDFAFDHTLGVVLPVVGLLGGLLMLFADFSSSLHGEFLCLAFLASPVAVARF